MVIALGFAIAGSVLLFLQDKIRILDYYRIIYYPTSGIMPACGALLILTVLIILIRERKDQKKSLPMAILSGVAAGMLIASICLTSQLIHRGDRKRLSSSLFWSGYTYAVIAGGFCLLVSILFIVHLCIKPKKMKGEIEPNWPRDPAYHEKLAHANEALDSLHSLQARGLLSEEEYRDEVIYTLYNYRVGKEARFALNFHSYQEKRWILQSLFGNEEDLSAVEKSSGTDL